MPDTQPAGGLMQALAPIVKRQPVHIIVSSGSDGALHVVIQPVRVDDKEDAEIARGFSVEAPAAELDADLPHQLAQHWVPARIGLRSILDQVKSAAEQTRQTTVKKAKDGKGPKKDATASGPGAQTTILAPGPKPDADGAPATAPAVPTPDDVPAAQQAETPAATDEQVADSTAPQVAASAPAAPEQPTAPEEPTGAAGELAAVGAGADDVSNLFD